MSELKALFFCCLLKLMVERMYKKISLALFGLTTALMLQTPAQAETVVERVAKTGVLNVSTYNDVVPYSYTNEQGQLVGYSVDMVELVRKQLEQELGKKVEVNFVNHSNFQERMMGMLVGEVDLACDNIFTWERDQFLDFSVPYSVSGIKLFTKKGANLTTREDLRGKKLAIVKTFLNERSVKTLESQVTIVPVDSLNDGIEAVKNGTADVFVHDAIILEGMRLTLDQPDAYEVIPQDGYFQHGVACMLPDSDSGFRRLVDYSLVKFMQQYLAGDPTAVGLMNKYFGASPEGIVPLDPERIKEFFSFVIMTREQIPLN
jgi:polar amino acid transport system substrate-binding protein